MKSPRRSVRAFALLCAVAGLVLWWRTASSPSRALPDPGAAAAGPSAPAAIAARAAPPLRSPAALSPVLAAPDSALGRFQSWAQRYLAAAPADRAALVPEGVQLATARRPVSAR